MMLGQQRLVLLQMMQEQGLEISMVKQTLTTNFLTDVVSL